MNSLFAFLLVAHVVSGLLGTIASFMSSFMLVKDTWNRTALIRVTVFAWVAYMISWFTGGWYYWKHYGSQVKPVIMKGEYTWAHLIFTEAKEHVFLFLPFIALVLSVLIYCIPEERQGDAQMNRAALILSLVVTGIAVVITLSGVLITGGARS